MVEEKLNIAQQLIANILKVKALRDFAIKYPSIYSFCRRHLTVTRFTGLPLTILVLAFVSNLLLIMDYTPDVINSKEFVGIDSWLANRLYSLRVRPLAEACSWATELCDIQTVLFISCAASILFLLQKKAYYIKALLVSLIGCGMTIYLSKNIFQVARPTQLAYEHEYSFSFPSGHATVAVAVYGLLFYFMMRNSNSVRSGTLIIVCAVVFALIIGFSRLYLCAHYLSDVLGGYMLGSVWLLLAISIFEWDVYLKSTRSQQARSGSKLECNANIPNK